MGFLHPGETPQLGQPDSLQASPAPRAQLRRPHNPPSLPTIHLVGTMHRHKNVCCLRSCDPRQQVTHLHLAGGAEEMHARNTISG